MNWALSGCEPRVLIADLFSNFFCHFGNYQITLFHRWFLNFKTPLVISPTCERHYDPCVRKSKSYSCLTKKSLLRMLVPISQLINLLTKSGILIQRQFWFNRNQMKYNNSRMTSVVLYCTLQFVILIKIPALYDNLTSLINNNKRTKSSTNRSRYTQ